MAQASHGSAPDIAGKGIANPYAEIMSMQMMLKHVGLRRNDQDMVQAAELIHDAVAAVIAEGCVLTPDIGGNSSTTAMGTAIVDLIPGET
jgi:3-isopropylmalate dehydrogenase